MARVLHRTGVAQFQPGGRQIQFAPNELAVGVLQRHIVAGEGLEAGVAASGAQVRADQGRRKDQADGRQQCDVEDFVEPFKHGALVYHILQEIGNLSAGELSTSRFCSRKGGIFSMTWGRATVRTR
jgi:hypothetical protein